MVCMELFGWRRLDYYGKLLGSHCNLSKQVVGFLVELLSS